MSEDEAFGRVTNPERYAVLHAAADHLIDELRQRHDVVVSQTIPEGPDVAGGLQSATTVSPKDGGSSLTVTKTGFPGLLVRRGLGAPRPLPACGCDACDEQPGDLIEELRHELRQTSKSWPPADDV